VGCVWGRGGGGRGGGFFFSSKQYYFFVDFLELLHFQVIGSEKMGPNHVESALEAAPPLQALPIARPTQTAQANFSFLHFMEVSNHAHTSF
jgi:hypothetical protein